MLEENENFSELYTFVNIVDKLTINDSALNPVFNNSYDSTKSVYLYVSQIGTGQVMSLLYKAAYIIHSHLSKRQNVESQILKILRSS